MGLSVQDRLEAIEMRVGGRTFRPAKKMSVVQDLYIWKLLKQAKIEDFLAEFSGEKGAFSGKGEELVFRAYETGVLFLIMATILVEVGHEKEEWTEARSQEVEHFLKYLDDDDDKALIRAQMVAVVLNFFTSEGDLQKASLRYSLSRKSESEKQSPSESVSSDTAPKISTSGVPSSENLPATILRSTSES